MVYPTNLDAMKSMLEDGNDTKGLSGNARAMDAIRTITGSPTHEHGNR